MFFDSVPTLEQLEETASFLKSQCPDFNALIGIQLGTGSNEMADKFDSTPKPISVPFSAIPNFSICTAIGHYGEFIFGYIKGVPVICLKGRVHLYEGISLAHTTFPIRVLAKLGIKIVVLTNAAGCLEATWNLGDIMIVSDHINMLGTNPLIGPNLDYFPPHSVRFPDMSNAYDAELRQVVKDAARECGISSKIREGVYLAYSGPSFETGAETRFFQCVGASSVGMSTVAESIVAVHSGLKCVALSVQTDICVADAHPDGEAIIQVGKEATLTLYTLIAHMITKLNSIAAQTQTPSQ